MSTTTDKVRELATRVLAIAQAKLTGTLQITAGEDRVKLAFFQQGCLADMDTGREDTLLEAALHDTRLFSERDLKHARKKAARADLPLGSAMLELGVAPDDVVCDAIRHRLTEELFEAFTWTTEDVQFLEHGQEERLEGFYSELADYYEVLVDAEDVIIEVTRRLERWDIVQESFPMLRDVFYATPASFHYFREQAQYPSEYAILTKVDGTKDVEEIIAESGVDPFVAVSLFRHLKAEGELELINPVQMFQLGVDCSSSGKHEKAYKLFHRAHERGLDDFDLQLKLAQSLDALGDRARAIAKYMDFAEKCFEQHRLDDALRSLRRVTQIDRGNLAAHEKCLEILEEQGRPGEVVDQALCVADLFRSRGETRAGLDTLTRVRAIHPKEIRLQQKIIELAEECGDQDAARTERELLARNCDEQKDVEVALDAYQKMFCGGNDSIEVRLKLVELHQAKGNRTKALEHINSLLNLPEKRRPRDETTLLKLHESVRDLSPGDLRSNRWLADYYTRQQEKEKAIEVLTSWISHLERENDTYEMVHAYEQLILLEDRYEYRWGLARVLEKMGRTEECREELLKVANLAIRQKKFTQAAKVVDHILKTSPLDLGSRKLQAELFEARNDRELAERRYEEVAILAIISGNVQEAELHCRRLDTNRPAVPEIIHRLGLLCRDQGDQQKAVEQLVKAARLHLQHHNHGLCRSTVNEVLALQPGHAEAKSLLGELTAADQQSAGQQAAAAPPPAASPAPQVVASPTPVAPAAPAHHQETAPSGSVTGGIFEPSPTIKTTVSSITARLRQLKGGGGNGASRPAAPPAAQEPAPAPAAQPVKKAGSGGTVVKSSNALKSAADRLKALAGKKAQQTEGSGSAARASSSTPSGDGSTSPPQASGGQGAPGPAAPAGAPSASAAGSGEPGNAPPTATRKMKLSGPAARLAALRNKAAQEA